MAKDKLSEGRYLTDMAKVMDDVTKATNTCSTIE
jgi:hypothetical protein